MAAQETDWVRIAIDAAGWAASTIGGIIIGAWRYGRQSANEEQTSKEDFDEKIRRLREEVRLSMSAYEKQSDARTDLLVSQFRESFEGIRRQIDDNRLSAEQRFLPRDDFREFRKEWRDDVERIFEKLDNIR